jgi:hypothetical protein
VPLVFSADFVDVVVGVPDRDVPVEDAGAVVCWVAVEPLADVVEPVEAADREAAVDLAGRAVLVVVAFAVLALATGAGVAALRAGVAVVALRTGAAGRCVVVRTPPADSRPGTVSAFGKPATWPLPPAGTASSGPTPVWDSPSATNPM